VSEARQEDEVQDLTGLSERASSALTTPRRTATVEERARCRCRAPSSSISMTTWLPFWKAFSAIVPTAGLPTARGRLRLDAVIDRVPHHVHERVAQLLHDQLVDLRLGAGDDEVDLFLRLAADLPDDARELVEDLPERDHAHLEDALLHRREVAVERALQPQQLGRRCVRSDWLARSRSTRRASWVRTIASSPTMFIRRSSLWMSTRTVCVTLRRLCAAAARASAVPRGRPAARRASARTLSAASGRRRPGGKGSARNGARRHRGPSAPRGISSIDRDALAPERPRELVRESTRDAIRMSSSIESALRARRPWAGT
jgi:hypothetical protein